MPRAFEAHATIARSADHVWRILTDWPRASRWMKGIDSLRADGPLAIGTDLVFEARGKRRAARITACEPGRRLILTSTQGAVTADYVYGIEPLDGDRCRVSLVAECRVAGPLAIFGPLLRFAVRRTDGDQITRLAALVDDTPPAAAG